MPKINNERLLSIKEVSNKTSLSVKTIRNKIAMGNFPIPYIKQGQRIYFKSSSVSKYLRNLKEIHPHGGSNLL